MEILKIKEWLIWKDSVTPKVKLHYLDFKYTESFDLDFKYTEPFDLGIPEINLELKSVEVKGGIKLSKNR